MISCALKNLRHFYSTVWVVRKACVHFPLMVMAKNEFWLSVPSLFLIEEIERV